MAAIPALTVTTPIGTQAAPFQVLKYALPEAIEMIETAAGPDQMRPLVPEVLRCLGDLQGLPRDVRTLTSQLVREGEVGGYLDPTLQDFQRALADSGLRGRLSNPAAVAAELGGLDPGDMVARAEGLGRSVSGALGERAPTFWRQVKHPLGKGKVICSVTPGEVLTCQGDARALRAHLMLGPNHPRTTALKAEFLGGIRYTGRGPGGDEQWARGDGSPITPDEVVTEFGGEVREAMGFRDLGLGPSSKANELPTDMGGRLPGRFGRNPGERTPEGRRLPSGTEEILDSVGLGKKDLAREGLGAHTAQFRVISRIAAMLLRVALPAYPALGGRLSEFYQPHEKGTVAAHSFPPFEVWQQLSASATEGKLDSPERLATALSNYPVALLNDLIGASKFRYGMERTMAAGAHGKGTDGFWQAFGQALEKIVPSDLAANGFAAQTGGPNVSLNAACAGLAYSVYLAQAMMIQGADDVFSPRRRFAPHMIGTFSVDATFETADGPAVVAGFGEDPPLSGPKIVSHMISSGAMPPLAEGETPGQRWRGLDRARRRELFDHYAAPLTNRSLGLPISEGAGGVLWERLDRVLKNGHFPTSILAGAWIGGGESGTGAVTGMSQGGVTTLARALALARQEHGVVPNLFYPHATNTPLFNVAEMEMMTRATEALGMTGVMLSAMIAAVGHTQGAATAVSTVMGIRSLMDQESPLLLKFTPEEMDPRFLTNPWVRRALDGGRLVLRGGTYKGDIPAIRVGGYGFGGTAGDLVLKHVPQDIDAAAEVLGQYEGVTADDLARWKDRAEERRARADEYGEALRKGEMTLGQVPNKFGYG